MFGGRRGFDGSTGSDRRSVRGPTGGTAVAVVAVALLALAGVGAAAGTVDGTPSGPGGVPQVEEAGPGEGAANGTSGDPLAVTYEVARTDSNLVAVTARFDVPAAVTRLRVDGPRAGRVVGVDGFAVDRFDGAFEWTRDSADGEPSISYRLPPAAASRFVRPDTDVGGGWLAANRDRIALRIDYRTADGTDPGGVERLRVAPNATGVAGDHVAYLGDHRTETAGAFTLVVPGMASLDPDRGDVFGTLREARRALSVGERSPTVRVFVAPALAGVGGFTPVGDAAEFVAPERASVASADNVWVHEYVHTRQNLSTTRATRWLGEATAEYYAALLTLRQGRIDHERFRASLSAGSYRGADLTAPGTWSSPLVPYERGARAVAAIDARIREATDGRRSFEDVFRRLNAREGALSAAAFERIVEDVAGENLDGFLERTLTEPVAVPDDRSIFVSSPDDGPAVEPVAGAVPRDPDGDGVYEDLNANGRLDYADVVIAVRNLEALSGGPYDFAGDGGVGYTDVVALFERVE